MEEPIAICGSYEAFAHTQVASKPKLTRPLPTGPSGDATLLLTSSCGSSPNHNKP